MSYEEARAKYDKDKPFSDPIVRCDSCQCLVQRKHIAQFGACSRCGHRRVRNVTMMTEAEFALVKTWDIDPMFLEMFTAREPV